MKGNFILFLKGIAMGGANVIPGVSGGTIAFITGIYDKLIRSLKSFDLHAVKLLLKPDLKAFLHHVNFGFLSVLVSGAILSLVTFGKALNYLMSLGEQQEQYVWSFFFGLIFASIYYVGKKIKEWSFSVVISGLTGLAAAISLAFLSPARENDSFLYLMICGAAAMSSMLLPGLSGSFILILMGNYQLIMLEAIPNRNLEIILSVGTGAIIGFMVLSRSISYLLAKHQSRTISGLTGFILGSLILIWPWKKKVLLLDADGEPLLRKGEEVVSGYEWLLPFFDQSFFIAVLLIFAGYGLVCLIEFLGGKKLR